MGISDWRLSKRILWTARTVHDASETIRLVSNPSVSRVLVKIRSAASSCGAIIVASHESADSLEGVEEEVGWEGRRVEGIRPGLNGQFCPRVRDYYRYFHGTYRCIFQSHISHAYPAVP